LARRNIVENAKNFDLKLLDSAALEDGLPYAALAGADLGQFEEGSRGKGEPGKHGGSRQHP
jgi:hypothetical protein